MIVVGLAAREAACRLDGDGSAAGHTGLCEGRLGLSA